jgi:hypothetical protein
VADGAADVPFADVLETLGGEPAPAEAEADEDTKPDAPKPKEAARTKPEPEKPEPPKSDAEQALDVDEALFTPEALATKEGVARAAEVTKAAVAAVKERNKILDRYDIRLKKKDERIKREASERQAKDAEDRRAWEAEREPMRHAAQEVIRELQILDPRSGASAVERFAALGRLNGGMDGRQLYEDWTLGIAADGKVPAPSRAEATLRAEIEQLRAALQQKLRGDEGAADQAKVEQLRQGVAGQMAEIKALAQNAEAYPAIAARVAAADDDGETLDEVAEWVKRAMVKAHERGTPLDKATAIGRVEARLARLTGGAPPAAKAAESGSSPKPGSPARGAGKGTTVLPTSADRSTGIVRAPKTEAERDAENLRDPAFLDALPFLR